jgi:hypothetical protein
VVRYVSDYISTGESAGEVVADINAPARALNFVEPSLGDFECTLRKALSNMDGRSAAGLDGVGAAFVKNAFFTSDKRPNDRVHIILPLLASICHKAYKLQAIPRQWQTSRIRPLFKKGEDILQTTAC